VVSHLVGDRIFTYSSESQAIEAVYPWTGRDCLWPVAPDGTLWLLKQDTFWGYNTNGWQSVALDLPPDENIYGFTAGSNGMLIVAAKAGLLIYTPSEGWTTVPQSQRWFYRNIVYDEPTNTLWGSTGHSYVFPGYVASYSLSTNVLTVYYKEEGAFYQDVPPGGVGISPDGAVWVVGTRGDVAVFAANNNWQPQQINTQGAMGFGEVYFGNSTDLWLITIDICGFESVCHSGLVYFDGMNSYRFSGDSGFRPGTYWIYDLSVDSQGNAWLATSMGLQQIPAP
jgi:hypothetical protein